MIADGKEETLGTEAQSTVDGVSHTDGQTIALLTRWEAFGGVWRIVDTSGGQVTLSLCRCDGGEEQHRVTTTDPTVIGWLGERTSSTDD